MILARLFVIVGGLVVVALLAALIGPYFINWTNYRADFEREASAILGRKVIVEGAAEARLLPFPSVTFSQVTVAGGPGGAPAMMVDKFSMDAELAPFLSGEFLIFDMRVERPRAVIEAAADGTIDWAVRPSSPIAANRIAIEKLTVTDGSIEIRHALSGRTHMLTAINADVSAKSLAGPWRLEGSLDADGVATSLSASTGVYEDGGRMRVRVRASPLAYAFTLDADGSVAKSKNGLGYSGEFHLNEVRKKPADTPTGAPQKAPPPGYRLNGQFMLDNQQIDVAAFRFETGPLDQPYTADGKAALAFSAAPRFSIEAKGAQVQFDEAIGATEGTDLSLDERIAAFEQAVAGLPKPTIPGTVKIDLPAVVVGDTTIRDVRVAAEPAEGGWAVKSVGATLPGRTTLEADGFLGTSGGFDFNGSLLLAVAQPSGFAAWFANDIDESIRRLPAAGFSAKVEMTGRRQVFRDLELVLGKARLTGEIDSRQPEGLDPSMSIKLDGGALDADGVAALGSLFVSEKGVNRFADVDLDMQLKAGPVETAGLSAGTVETALRLHGGTLDIDKLAIGGLAGASIGATGVVRDFPVNPSGSFDASLVAVDLAPLISLSSENFPDNPLLRQLRRRIGAFPGLFSDSNLNIVTSTKRDADGIKLATLDLNGQAGGSALSLSTSLKGEIGDWRNASVSLSGSASNNDATALLALAGLQTLPLSIAGSGELTLQASGAPAGGLATTIGFRGEGMNAAFDGTTGLGDEGLSAKGKVSLTAEDIEPWLLTVGVALPGLGSGMAVDLSAQADFAAKLLVLENIDGVIDESSIAGDLNAEIDQGMPRFTGALVVDSLALDPLAAIVLGEPSLVGDPGRWAAVPFTQKAAMPFAAKVDVSADTLIAGSFTASAATLSLQSNEDGLRVDDLNATYDGGRLTGNLQLKNNFGTGLVAAQLHLDGADISREPALAGITGSGDFSASLSGSGKSVEAIVASLSGSGTAALKAIKVEGINEAAFPELLKRADALGRDIDASRVAGFVGEAVRTGSVDGGDVQIAFTVANGVLRAPSFTLGGDPAKLTTDLQADMNAATVDAKGALAFSAGEDALTGSDPTVRFSLTGPIGDAKLALDSEPMAQFLTQRALEREQRRVEAMQAVLLEKQRLRREVRYYASLAAERNRIEDEARQAAEEARAKAAEEARLQAEEEIRRKQAEEEQKRLDAEAAAKAQAEAQQKAEAAQKALEEAEKERLAAEARTAREAEEAARKLEESTTPQQMAPPTPRSAPPRSETRSPAAAAPQPSPFDLRFDY